MAKATTALIGFEINIKLTRTEAEALKGMMQNPLHDPESAAEFEVRQAIFMALKNAGVP